MKYLEIAKVINTHGLQGEVKILCNYYGQNFTKWKPKQLIYLKNINDYQALTIKSIRTHNKYFLVTFEAYQTIDSVLFMKNKSLVVIDSEIKTTDNFTFENLIDYQAINNHDQKTLGQIVALVDNNHSGLWQVIATTGKIFYVPNNKFFIVKINKNEKIVYLNVISGMFDYE